jgi:hypothetical protein
MATVTVQCDSCSADERADLRRSIEENYAKDDVMVEVRLSRAAAVITVEYAMETAAVGGPGGAAPQPAPRDVTERVRQALRAAGRQVV